MRILICGGREYDDWEEFSSKAYDLIFKVPIHKEQITIISGEANGADFLARVFAKYWGIEYKGYPADWKKYGRGAGPIRNQQMLDEGQPDYVLAFPGGAGTADMVRRAKKAGVEVINVS